MAGKLFLTGTPIGNLGDLTPRAAEAFEKADFIAAEDTRVTMKLLNHLGLKKPLVSYYEHNKAESGERIIRRILGGENCVLVSDAGMPAISDPGEALVVLCAEAGIEVTVLPGPSAVVCAMALSGLPSGRFTFEGFLSVTKKSRYEHLAELKKEKRTMVFYEAPHKLMNTLEDFRETVGPERPLSVCRELTKLHEETLRFTVGEAIEHFTAFPPKGEFVLVVGGAPEEEEPEMTMEQALMRVKQYRDGGMSLKNAAKQASLDTGFGKNELYDAFLNQE